MTGLNGDKFATKIDAVSVTKSTGPLNYSFYFRWKHLRAPKERVPERVLQKDDLILL